MTTDCNDTPPGDDGENQGPRLTTSPRQSRLRRVLWASSRVLWWRWVDREVATYPETLTGDDRDRCDTLRANVEEVAKQARGIFILHLSIAAYALLTLGGVRDQDFYGRKASVKLPAIGAEVSAGIFFVAMPLLMLLVGLYLHVYLGYLHRLRRRLGKQWMDFEHQDYAYPWIASIAQLPGFFGWIVRNIYHLLVWWVTPAILLLYWGRLLVLRSTVAEWLDRGSTGLAAARVVGLMWVGAIATAAIWSAARRSIDSRFGLTASITLLGIVLRIGLLGIGFGLVVSQWSWLHCWRAADLRQAVLSQPATPGGVDAIGVNLPGARLTGADLSGAYLEAATLQGADLRSARMIRTNAKGADFSGARLEGAQLIRAHLEGAGVESGHR